MCPNEYGSTLFIHSVELRTALLKAGWRPGVCRRHRVIESNPTLLGKMFSLFARSSSFDPYDDPYHVDTVFRVFPTAKLVLDELWGLRIEPLAKKGSLLPRTVVFDLGLLFGAENDIDRIASLLKTDLVPIGQILSSDILLMSPSEHVFALSFVSTGVSYEGQGLDNALLRILQGQISRPVLFSATVDPGLRFENDFISTVCGPPIHIDAGMTLGDIDLKMPD